MDRPWMERPAPPLPTPVPKCRRSDCKKPGATFWNRSTLDWYCPECAHSINRANGIELCVIAENAPDERSFY